MRATNSDAQLLNAQKPYATVCVYATIDCPLVRVIVVAYGPQQSAN